MTIGLNASAEEVITYLKTLRDDKSIAGMGRFGIDTAHALGISNPVLRALARWIKRNHLRALALWQSGIREARVLASFTDEPTKVTAGQARAWAAMFQSWEIVDHSSDLFVGAGLCAPLIKEFAGDDREFVRRTAFSMMAIAAVHLKKEPDETMLAWLPLVEQYAQDPRNFVRKAVNWALRQIGKRNRHCHGPALELAEKLGLSADKTARWIGRDAGRELTSEAVLRRLKD